MVSVPLALPLPSEKVDLKLLLGLGTFMLSRVENLLDEEDLHPPVEEAAHTHSHEHGIFFFFFCLLVCGVRHVRMCSGVATLKNARFSFWKDTIMRAAKKDKTRHATITAVMIQATNILMVTTPPLIATFHVLCGFLLACLPSFTNPSVPLCTEHGHNNHASTALPNPPPAKAIKPARSAHLFGVSSIGLSLNVKMMSDVSQ
jgi:hypothetical protein